MSEDLDILSSMSTSMRDLGIRSLVEFGYGVEAVFSHEITRFHHDIDIALVLTLSLEEQSAYTKLPRSHSCKYRHGTGKYTHRKKIDMVEIHE